MQIKHFALCLAQITCYNYFKNFHYNTAKWPSNFQRMLLMSRRLFSNELSVLLLIKVSGLIRCCFGDFQGLTFGDFTILFQIKETRRPPCFYCESSVWTAVYNNLTMLWENLVKDILFVIPVWIGDDLWGHDFPDAYSLENILD